MKTVIITYNNDCISIVVSIIDEYALKIEDYQLLCQTKHEFRTFDKDELSTHILPNLQHYYFCRYISIRKL